MKAAAAALFVLAAALPARGVLRVAEYRERLERLDALLAGGDGAAAAREAKALLDEEIRWGGETIQPDGTVLQPIVDRADALRGPLRTLIAALPSADIKPGAARADAAALAALEARQAGRAPQKGGALPGAPAVRLSFVEQVWKWVSDASMWLGDRLVELWRWLKKWWPSRPAGGPAAAGRIDYWVFAVVGAILVAVAALAVRAVRRGEAAPAPRAKRQPRDADADPLSRAANEWEDRARALAAEGKPREAIRAWYHALLVSSFRAGALHHRRGRTNREYASALAADVPWRGQFAELTGRFDLEWYGHAESSAESLAVFAAGAQGILAELGTQR